MSAVPKAERCSVEEVSAAFSKHGGNIRATAKELGISRSSVRRILANTGLLKKPLAGGTIQGTETLVYSLPPKGQVYRYIITSAQNNTYVHEKVWNNLLALAEHYRAYILVGTYTYNQNHYGKLSVKRGKDKPAQKELWYDPSLQVIGVSELCDKRVQLANGLVYCGEYNALPTNHNPLANLESYTGRKSAIFPHAKLAMRSVPSFQGEGVKLNFTTGTVTMRNYIQKREGTMAEFHHVYGGLLVEVNSDGNWWVRQLNQDEGTGTMQDLRVLVKNGEIVSTNAPIEAVTWGDLHATMVDEGVLGVSLKMLDELQPKYQFLHDVLEGASINRHVVKNEVKCSPHYAFHRWLRGLHRVDEEFRRTADVIKQYIRPWSKILAPDANHDAYWLHSWLNRYDYRVDPANSEFFLDLQNYMYMELRKGQKEGLMPRDVNMMQYAFSKFGLSEKDIDFLADDESFKTCGGKIENAMHGHLGPNGRFASPELLSKMGRKANIAHTHSAGIWNGLYVAGTSSKLKWTYNWGPSSWTHAHIVTYPNGKRSIISLYAGQWRAE